MRSGPRVVVSLVTGALVIMLASGCARLTTIEPQGQPSPYEVSVKTDPVTNKPPQTGWLTFRLLKESPIKRGKATQLVFNVSERGNPVTALWSYLGAPGQLWVVDEDGNNFAHLEGASEAHSITGPGEVSGGGEPASSS